MSALNQGEMHLTCAVKKIPVLVNNLSFNNT